MCAEILYGSKAAAAITKGLIERTERLADRGIVPCLAILRVGERSDDCSYERAAIKRCEKIGIKVKSIALPELTEPERLEKAILELNADSEVHGVLMFRPLPKHLDERYFCQLLSAEKDADGITDLSMASVYSGSGCGFAPCTAQACVELLKHYGVDLSGKRVAIVGRSLVVGRPAALLFMRENATVTLCHTKTLKLAEELGRADIVVAAAGKIKAVTGDCLAPGQIVVDVGVNLNAATGKLCGDVDFEAAESIAAAVSPVPGGVGAVTTSILAMHVIEAAEKIWIKINVN